MSSDTLREAERLWLLTLLVWGGANVVAGTALYATFVIRSRGSDLLRSFAMQCVAWGAVQSLGAGILLANLHDRDLTGAMRLDRMLWFGWGLATGIVVLGATLAIVTWRAGRTRGVGAGIAIAVQGSALLFLVAQLLAITGKGL